MHGLPLLIAALLSVGPGRPPVAVAIKNRAFTAKRGTRSHRISWAYLLGRHRHHEQHKVEPTPQLPAHPPLRPLASPQLPSNVDSGLRWPVFAWGFLPWEFPDTKKQGSVALVRNADVMRLRARLEIKRYYEIAWGAAFLIVCLLTSLYAVHANAAKAAKSCSGKLGASEIDLEKPLEGIATEDGHTLDLTQKGYIRCLSGEFLLYLWALLPVAGYLQMVSFTLDEYLYALHTPDQTWTQLAEPFLVLFLISHFVLFLQAKYGAWARVFFMEQVEISQATKVLISDPKLGPSKDVLVPIETCTIGKAEIHYFEYTCVRYVWSDADGLYTPKGVENICGKEGANRLRKGGLTDGEFERASTAGDNVIHVKVPNLPRAVFNEYMSPIYIFQFSCIWTYMFYSTWNIAMCWLVLALVSGTARAILIRRTQLDIQKMAATETQATVYREKQWKEVGSAEVVPGDILKVCEGVACCDIALLRGGAVVNESMLTGEPMPVQRFQAEASDLNLDPIKMKRNFIFAGTIVMQSSAGPDSSETFAVGVACKTGARTAKGALVRMVLFPSPAKFRFTQDMSRVYLLMLIWVFTLFVICCFTDQGHWLVSVFSGLCILTQSLNPNLPVSLTLAQSVSAARLNSSCEIKCLNPSCIPIAGKVHVMVLDKTGTITKDGMDFAGVRPSDPIQRVFLPMQEHDKDTRWSDLKDLPSAVLWSLAACHTVTILKSNDGSDEFIGNMVEVAMFRASGWLLEKDCKSIRDPVSGTVISIVKQLEFDHRRMTSGVVVQVAERDKPEKVLVLMKGSYEKIRDLVDKKASLPQDFKEVTEHYAEEQYYVLGLGVKELTKDDISPTGLNTLRRDDVEQGLTFYGLLLFRNEIKPDSFQALKMLKDGNIRCVMCTGDNALTGVAIGRKCSMLQGDSMDHRTILGDADGSAEEEVPKISWTTLPDRKEMSQYEVFQSDPKDTDIVLSRSAFSLLQKRNELDGIVDKVRIYARMKPEDKVAVINLHQDRGWMVGMVGDGGNDCGALRAANVGLALSDAEASIVAPFSSGATYGTDSKSLMACIDVIRFGRACLATNLATFMYFMVYAFCLPMWKLVLMFDGSKLMSEWDYVFIDIAIGSFMVGFMTLSWPATSLSKIRPTASLLGPRTVTLALGPGFIFVFFAIIGHLVVRTQPFYLLYDANELGIPGHLWQFKGDNYDVPITFVLMATQYASVAFGYSFGAEFRRSVWRNFWIFISYIGVLLMMFFLIWSGPNAMNCVFRINCDCKVSQEMYVPIIGELSTGNIGGCFLGPQILKYKRDLGKDFVFPDKDANQCKPHSSAHPFDEIQNPSGGIKGLGNDICRGPNNCWSTHFRSVVTYLVLGQVIVTQAFIKVASMLHPAPKTHFPRL